MDSETDWERAVAEFERLMVHDGSVEAVQRFYADDAIVFENRTMARAGRDACMRWECEQRQQMRQPPVIRVRSRAKDPKTRTVFMELITRWTDSNGSSLRLETVRVQRWEAERITQERFYYEGVVDESDDEPSPSTVTAWTKLGG